MRHKIVPLAFYQRCQLSKEVHALLNGGGGGNVLLPRSFQQLLLPAEGGGTLQLLLKALLLPHSCQHALSQVHAKGAGVHVKENPLGPICTHNLPAPLRELAQQ